VWRVELKPDLYDDVEDPNPLGFEMIW